MRLTGLFLFLFSALVLTGCEQEYKLFDARCGSSCYTGDPETRGVGACFDGIGVCEGGLFVECEGEGLPQEELCDLIDNNCNGIIDDEVRDTGIDEECGSEVGSCSFGRMKCVSGAIDCIGASWPQEESCDGLDNDCNGMVDDMEALGYCYDGDPEDLWYGECHAGILVCESGSEVCQNQQLPTEELCDGFDNDCDGFVDEDLDEGDEVDIVFILDRSGSMSSHFSSVASAAQLFAAAFTGIPEFRFALVGIPPESGSSRDVEVLLDFTDAGTFVTELSLMTTTMGGLEASYDAPYLSSDGSLYLSWDSDSRKYIVLFTDEAGQSYIEPDIDEMDVANELLSKDITFYGFIKSSFWGDFDQIASLTGGSIYNLGSSTEMEEDLSEIFADECWE